MHVNYNFLIILPSNVRLWALAITNLADYEETNLLLKHFAFLCNLAIFFLCLQSIDAGWDRLNVT